MRSNNKNKVFNWLWKDLFYPWKKVFITNFLLDILAFSSQLGAYGVLFKYVSTLEENAEFYFMGEAYVPKSSHTLLLAVAICTGLLFIASSIFNYWSKIRTVNLNREYEQFCSHRILDALHHYAQLDKSNSKNYDLRHIKRALIKDARFCGKFVPIVSLAIIVIIKFTLSLAFMFNIDPLLTGIILLMIIPFFFLTKYIGKQVVEITVVRESKLPIFIGAKKRLMNAIVTNPEQTKEELHEADNDPDIVSFYDTHFGAIKKLAVNDFFGVLFIALLAVVIILTGGELVLFGNMPWSIFIAYIIALRFFFGALQGLSGLVKKSSKIYEYIDHYLQLLKALQSGDFSSTSYGMQKEVVMKDKSDNIGLDLDDDDDDDDDDGDDL